MYADRLRILIVDDNPGDILLARQHLKDAGLDTEVRSAGDGIAALEMLRTCADAGGASVSDSDLPDVVLTDMHMPRMDGLALVESIRREFPSVPVVLMTAYGSEEIAFQCLQRGAASYVPKRDIRDGLAPTLQQIAELSRAQRQDERIQACLAEVESTWLLENDIGLVAPLARQIGAAYRKIMRADETDQFRLTLVLHEALSNAIYHGNLEVSTGLRSDASGSDAFHRLAEERRGQAPYRDRRVRVTARIAPDQATFVVRDQGPGFNVSVLPDPRDRSNLEQIGGRGLFLIRLFMDEVRHDATGCEITMIKKRGGA